MADNLVELKQGRVLTVTPTTFAIVSCAALSLHSTVTAVTSFGPYYVDAKIIVSGDATVSTGDFTASDITVADLASTASGKGAALVAWKELGGVDRDVLAKLRNLPRSPDDRASLQAALTAGSVLLPHASSFSTSTALDVAAPLVGDGTPTITSSAATALDVAAGARLSGFAVVANGTDQALSADADATDVLLASGSVYTPDSATSGHGVQINALGAGNWRIHDYDFDTRGFSVLVNLDAEDMDGLIVSGSRITSRMRDALEYNTPDGTGAQNIVTFGNILSAGLSTTANAAYGFSIGHAHNINFATVGNVSKGSLTAGIHAEDGLRFGTIVGNVLADNLKDGIWTLASGNGGAGNYATALPLVLVGNSIGGQASPVAGTSGYVENWDGTDHQLKRSIFADTFVWGFARAVSLLGPGPRVADNVSTQNCPIVLRIGGASWRSEHYGRFISKDATTFVSVPADSRAVTTGHFHQEGYLPASFVTYETARSVPGCNIERWSGRANSGGAGVDWSTTGVNGASVWVPIAPEARRVRGIMRVSMRDNASPTIARIWEAEVFYDGTTWTFSNRWTEGLSADWDINTTALRMNGGNCEISVFQSSVVVRSIRFDVEFLGPTWYV